MIGTITPRTTATVIGTTTRNYATAIVMPAPRIYGDHEPEDDWNSLKSSAVITACREDVNVTDVLRSRIRDGALSFVSPIAPWVEIQP